MQSRYYNPEWGRFINADGLVGKPGELLSHNMFAYCENNPVNAHDPSGYVMLEDFGGSAQSNKISISTVVSTVKKVNKQAETNGRILIAAALISICLKEFENKLTTMRIGKVKNTFTENPDEMLTDVPSITTERGNIKWEPNKSTRIQYHPGDEVKPGEVFNPRHHGPHYHVEIRLDTNKGWNNPGNIFKMQPPGYTIGSGTGFLPGEEFPR